LSLVFFSVPLSIDGSYGVAACSQSAARMQVDGWSGASKPALPMLHFWPRRPNDAITALKFSGFLRYAPLERSCHVGLRLRQPPNSTRPRASPDALKTSPARQLLRAKTPPHSLLGHVRTMGLAESCERVQCDNRQECHLLDGYHIEVYDSKAC
jgi:hypothetical protein